MAQQSLLAIEEADVVMFLVDARAGLLPADKGIADHLRRINKQVFVVANKVDGIDGDSESAEFYALGLGNVKQIAAVHGRGVSQLLQEALSPLDASFPDMQVVEAPKEEDLGAEAQRGQLPCARRSRAAGVRGAAARGGAGRSGRTSASGRPPPRTKKTHL